MSESSARRPLTIILCCLIGAAALTLSAALLSRFMVRVQQRSENTISVKGVAERKIVSDLGAFTCSVWVDAPTVKDGYLELEKAYTRLYKALIARGFRDDEMCEQRLYYTRVTKTVRTVENGQTRYTEVFSHYHFCESIRVKTDRVMLIQQEALNLNALLAEGVNVEIESPQYFITNPEQYKQQLVDEATVSAYQRAATLAARTGSRVTRLLRGRQGIIQITRPASDDISDGGVYDTSTVEKNMRMVVTLDFETN